MTINEVVVKVASEGGSVALYGLRSEAGWRYSLDFINPEADATPNGTEAVVDSWAKAIDRLNRYPWHRLSPTLVHPEFRAEVLGAVTARCESEDGSARTVPEKWKALCAAPASGDSKDLSSYQTDRAVHSSDAFLCHMLGDEPNSGEEREYLRNEMLKAGLTEDDIKDMF